MNRWKKVAGDLARLAEDQAGHPEGDRAREKLAYILAKYPEARDYGPVRQFMLSDLREMMHEGVDTSGSWTGRNLQEALQMMTAEYRVRLEANRRRRQLLNYLEQELKEVEALQDENVSGQGSQQLWAPRLA